jgi:hypothetical protein
LRHRLQANNLPIMVGELGVDVHWVVVDREVPTQELPEAAGHTSGRCGVGPGIGAYPTPPDPLPTRATAIKIPSRH